MGEVFHRRRRRWQAILRKGWLEEVSWRNIAPRGRNFSPKGAESLAGRYALEVANLVPSSLSTYAYAGDTPSHKERSGKRTASTLRDCVDPVSVRSQCREWLNTSTSLRIKTCVVVDQESALAYGPSYPYSHPSLSTWDASYLDHHLGLGNHAASHLYHHPNRWTYAAS